MALGVHSIFNNAANYVFGARTCSRPDYTHNPIFTPAVVRSPEQPSAMPQTCDMGSVANVVMNALAAKDPYTQKHSHDVEADALGFGQHLGLPPEMLTDLGYAAKFHDIGKFCVPEATLGSKERLTDAQFEEIKKHPTAGRNIMEPVCNKQVLDAIEDHHEWFDGSKGYPNKKKGDQISYLGRIISIVDAADAMKGRAYNKGMSNDQILAELKRGAGTHFDPELVKAYIDYSKTRTNTNRWNSWI